MSERKKFLREDWINTGIHILTDESHNTLMLKNLCARLNVTKGSFYHHFSGWSEYIDSLLEHIHQVYAEDFYMLIDKQPPLQRFEFLNTEIRKIPFRLAANMRCWANYNEKASKYQIKADLFRISFIEKWFNDAGVDKIEAFYLAKAHYFAFIGMEYYCLNNQDFDLQKEGLEIISLWNNMQKAYLESGI
jgi:AcrR family transcriptional regulator